ncbi:MAG: methane monooxygenase/ammonia monooxygenase subunit B [Nitrososphaera sp.]|nr:methane monooxygenase/ammonia monooxygenase subunit B [Nitrososphaera sp.]
MLYGIVTVLLALFLVASSAIASRDTPPDLSARDAEALRKQQEATKREEADAKAIGLDVGVEGAPYWIGERTMAITFWMTNNSNAPVDLAEVESGGYRFLNPVVLVDASDYPKSMLADDGLKVEDERPIAPGETRKIKIMVTNTKWETEKLSSLFYGQDHRFTGRLRFINNVGKPYIVPVK